MYSAAYQTCGLGYDYQACDTSSMDDIWASAQDPQFGGANISRPFKVAIVEKLAAKSFHAEAIGAINTLIPLRGSADGKVFPIHEQMANRGRAGPIMGWYGDNTDWIGLSTCIVRSLSPRNVIQPLKTTGLVIGAGGMARASIYALIQLGCRKVYIYNGTKVKAENVASHFNSWL
jgi:shikimate 5-dehydrogenase